MSDINSENYSKLALEYMHAHDDKIHVVTAPSRQWYKWLDYWKAHGIPHAYNLKVGKADVPSLWPSEFDPNWEGR